MTLSGASLLVGPGIPRLLPRLLLAATLAACGPPAEPPAVPTAPAVQPSEPDPGPEAEHGAFIDVIAAQPTEILLDGKPIGSTPISGHKVSPGAHEVTFIDEARGNRTMMVTVEQGEAKTVQSDVAPSAVEMGNQEKDKKK